MIRRKDENKLKTHWGFPVADGDGQPVDVERNGRKGVALIIAILGVAMIMIFSSNLIVNSQVNLEISMSNRDNLKAEYMAKSGFNLALFLIQGDFLKDIMMTKMQMPMQDVQGGDDLWTMLNDFPIGGDSAEMIAAFTKGFDLSEVNDESVLQKLQQFDGSFVLNIADEAGKINISRCLYGRCSEVLAMLESLFSCPVEKEFLEEKGLKGSELAQRIKDWVDDNTSTEGSGFSRENDPYEKQIPPYETKNAPMESLSELKLVEGWDEDMHTVFSPYLTIYPFPKNETDAQEFRININTAPKALLGCLLPQAKVDCGEKFHLTLAERSREGKALANDRQGIKQVLSEVFCADAPTETGDKSSAKDDWFTTRSTIFRINVAGDVAFKQKRLEAVIERVMPDKSKKIESSYRILYWRMI